MPPNVINCSSSPPLGKQKTPSPPKKQKKDILGSKIKNCFKGHKKMKKKKPHTKWEKYLQITSDKGSTSRIYKLLQFNNYK